MLLNLTELLNTEGKKKEYDLPFTEELYHAPTGGYPVRGAKEIHLVVTHHKNRKLTVVEHAEFSLEIPCDRCLTKVDVPFVLDFSRDLDLNSTADEHLEELDEQPYVTGTELDVDLLTEDELISLLPAKVLCKEDCKGFCKSCGVNLNLQTCNCEDHSSEDPRMSAIRDIFNKFKEV